MSYLQKYQTYAWYKSVENEIRNNRKIRKWIADYTYLVLLQPWPLLASNSSHLHHHNLHHCCFHHLIRLSFASSYHLWNPQFQTYQRYSHLEHSFCLSLVVVAWASQLPFQQLSLVVLHPTHHRTSQPNLVFCLPQLDFLELIFCFGFLP